MDWSFETFCGNKFRGSTILDGRARFSKHFAGLNFRSSRRIRENRENYAPRKFGTIRYIILRLQNYHYSQQSGIVREL